MRRFTPGSKRLKRNGSHSEIGEPFLAFSSVPRRERLVKTAFLEGLSSAENTPWSRPGDPGRPRPYREETSPRGPPPSLSPMPLPRRGSPDGGRGARPRPGRGPDASGGRAFPGFRRGGASPTPTGRRPRRRSLRPSPAPMGMRLVKRMEAPRPCGTPRRRLSPRGARVVGACGELLAVSAGHLERESRGPARDRGRRAG